HAYERRDAGVERGHADLPGGLQREAGMLDIHVERVEAGGGGDARDLDAADKPHRHRRHHLVALELLLDVVAQDVADRHCRPSLLVVLSWPYPWAGGMVAPVWSGQPGEDQELKLSMNYTTDFKSIRGQVSAQEWQARVDLAACYRLVDKYGMTDLIYNHITARIPGSADHLLINLYGML